MGLFDWLFKSKKNKVEKRIDREDKEIKITSSQTFQCENKEEAERQTSISTFRKGEISVEKIDIDVVSIENVKKRFIAFDLETTGFNEYSDRIVEIGAVVFEEGQIKDKFCSLVNPGMLIPAEATRVNNITNKMVESAPKEREIMEKFIQFVGNAIKGEVVVCAHNAKFDIGFLTEALRRQGIDATIKYIDTLALARKIVKDSVNYKLATLAEYYDIPLQEMHRADYDAEVCGTILNKLLYSIDLKLEDVREEIRRHTPEENELEVCAYIQKGIVDSGLDTDWLRFSKNTDKYVHVKYLYSFLKIKCTKKGNYIIVRKAATRNLTLHIEPCTKSEGGEEYCRVYFDRVFDLDVLIPYFVEVCSHCRKAALEYIESSEYCKKEAQKNIETMKALTLDEMNELLNKAMLRKNTVPLKEKTEEQIKKKEFVERKVINQPVDRQKTTGRSVYQMTDDMEIIKKYNTISEAVRETGVNAKSIRDAAKGIQKHAGGYVWRYADE